MALQSIVPEVDEEEGKDGTETLSATFPHPEESPKALKKKLGLVEFVLVSAYLLHDRPRLTDAISTHRW